jgi:hypothetical protein
MAAIRFTNPKLEKLKAPSSRRIELFDDLVTGLCFRCTDKGAKSRSLLCRFNGELRRDTLGRYPEISLSQARQRARDTLSLVEDKKDPRAIAAAAEAAEAERRRALQENNVKAVVEEFIRREASQLRWPELERTLCAATSYRPGATAPLGRSANGT